MLWDAVEMLYGPVNIGSNFDNFGFCDLLYSTVCEVLWESWDAVESHRDHPNAVHSGTYQYRIKL